MSDGRPLDPTVTADTSQGPPDSSVVRQLGDYELQSEIARGGMGIVYKARQISLNRPVAFKMILSGEFASARELGRFHDEVEAAASLDHANIVPIYEVGQHQGRHFFSMKLVEGNSLAREIPRLLRAPREGVSLLAKVCRAIHYAHQRGILHRDLKPANILVDSRGEPHVTDFGVAKRVEEDSDLTQTGVLVGTPSYMAPEQASRHTTAVLTTAVDIYSLGAILYELLTGRPPFSGVTRMDTVIALLNREPARPRTFNASADPDLETIALKCLEKEPARRYGSAEALAEDLERWLANEPIQARAIGTWERAVKWARRRPMIAALGAGILLVTLVGMAGVFWQWRQAELQRAVADELSKNLKEKVEAEVVARDAAERSAAAELDARQQEAEQRRFAEAQTVVAEQALAAAQTNLYFNNLDQIDRETLAANVSHVDQLHEACPPGLRNWEWHYLGRVAHMEDVAIAAHGTIRTIAFNPGGDRFLSAGSDQRLRAWDAKTQRQISAVTFGSGLAGRLDTVEFSADGTTVAALALLAEGGQVSASLGIWDTSTGQARFVLPRRTYGAFAFSADGKRLITASADGAKKLRVWESHTGAELAAPADVQGFVTNLTSSPNGRYLAAAVGPDIKVIDLESGTAQLTLNFAENPAIAFSRDGTAIAGVARTTGVSVWNLPDGKARWSARPGKGVNRAAFSPDGKYLAIALDDRTVRLLDAGTGQELALFIGHTGPVTTVTFTPDGTRLLSAGTDKTIRVWRVRSVTLPLVLERGETGPLQGVAMSADQRFIVAIVGTEPAGTFRAWDARTGRQLFAAEHRNITPIRSIAAPAFSRDGTRVVFPRVALFDFGNGRLTARPDLEILASSTGHGLLTLRSRQAGREASDATVARNFSQFETVIARDLAVSPHLDRVALVSQTFVQTSSAPAKANASHVEVWDAHTGRSLTRIDLGEVRGDGLQFAPDGRRLAVVSARDPVRSGAPMPEVTTYDTRTGRALQKLTGAQLPIAFSRDGRQLAATGEGRTIAIWDSTSDTKVGSLPDHGGTILSVAFSPNGTRLVSVTDDGSVKVWDAVSGHLAATLRESSGPYQVREWAVAGRPMAARRVSVSFSDDGTQIVLMSVMPDDKGMKMQVRTWDGTPRKSRLPIPSDARDERPLTK